MMRKWIMAVAAILAVAITSCSESTDRLGSSLTSPADKFNVTTDTFNVSTRSIKADSVLSRGVYSYIGRIKDPETGAYITSDFMTQFNMLEKMSTRLFPEKEKMKAAGYTYNPVCTNCELSIIINSYQGDSLAAMKVNLLEMKTPMAESKTYYTNFDPEKEGYIRTDKGAVNQKVVYSMVDLTLSDSIRNVRRQNGYYEVFNIPMNNLYIDKDGVEYNNFGTYVMTKYYDHPEYFKNSKTFARNICPGFYFKCIDGLGVMTEVAYVQLSMEFQYERNDTVYESYTSLNSSEEVLQTTHITNNTQNIMSLVSDNSCTYLKAPAGIYTEATLPIEEIKTGHENDSITSARVVFSRMNEKSEYSHMVLEEPTKLLMVERDSLYTFFEKNGIPNNKTSYLATFNSTYKTYTFNNISALVNHMWAQKGKKADWNKVVLIPVQVETSGSSTATVSTVSNQMSLSSVRLVGGSENKHLPVRISVIYNKTDK